MEDEAVDGSVERRNGEIRQGGCRGPFSGLFGAGIEELIFSVAASELSALVVAS